MWCAREVLNHIHHYINCFFKPITRFAVDINCYLNLISANYMCYYLHFVLIILRYSGEWMGSWLQFSSGNESRSRKEKIMKWVFQTLAKDRDLTINWWVYTPCRRFPFLYRFNIYITFKFSIGIWITLLITYIQIVIVK